MTEDLTNEELLAQQEEDPEAYVERVQEARDEETERAEGEEDIARARSGRPSLEEERKEQEAAAKVAEDASKKQEAASKKAE